MLAKCRRLRADKQQRCRELATYIATCIKVQSVISGNNISTMTAATAASLGALEEGYHYIRDSACQ